MKNLFRVSVECSSLMFMFYWLEERWFIIKGKQEKGDSNEIGFKMY